MTRSDLVHKFFPMQQAMKIPDGKAAVDKEWKMLETIQAWDLEKKKKKTRAKHQVARGMGSPRLASNRRRRTREGPEPACVQAPFFARVAHAGREGRIDVVPWYRLVGVVRTSSESHEGKTGLPARVRGHHVVWG